MQARFSDAISERRAAVLECLSAVEHEQRWQHVGASETVSTASLRTSMPTVVPGETRQSTKQEHVKVAAVLALVVAAGAALLVLTRNASPALPEAAAPASQLLASDQVRAQLPAREAEPADAPLSAGLLASGSGALATKQAAPALLEKPAIGAADAPRHAPSTHVKRALPAPAEPLADSRVRSPGTNAQPLPSAARAQESPASREQESAQEQEHVAPTRGRLRLDASPYAVVSLAGRRLGITPIDVELPAATHILTLRNPERGIETTYRVQVVAGESLLRRVELE
jgi:hypothetical protein